MGHPASAEDKRREAEADVPGTLAKTRQSDPRTRLEALRRRAAAKRARASARKDTPEEQAKGAAVTKALREGQLRSIRNR